MRTPHALVVLATLMAQALTPVVAHANGTDVTIATKDKATLAATFFPAATPGPAAIIFRNCDEGRGRVADFALALQARGVSVLSYDYRSGVIAGKNYRETRIADMEGLHAWLVRQSGVAADRLAAIGGSCGVQAALDFAKRYSPHVRAAVVLSGGGEPDQHAFIRTAPHLGIFGVGSRPEGAPEFIDNITRASSNPATRRIMLEERRHGTLMLDDAATRTAVISWLLERLAASAVK